ncbi:MAG TPA: pitrilysin family protein [Stellaceae bacterium]|nr:pitrilysin family protein [Stellaceae bacterium]
MLLSASTAAPASAQQFDAESFTLANGLKVAVLPSHRVPAITVMVWYKVGAADDPRGKSGIAHFLEHLMFKGTKDVPPGALTAQIARNGGRNNAFTAEDYTAFYETVARDRLDMVLRLEADRMTGLVLDDRVVLPERDVILEERRMRIDNEPSALLAEQLNAALFLNASYHNPTIGWETEMRGLRTEDALAFYRRWYAPNNAVLVIAGDVTAAEARPLVERYFDALPQRPIPDRLRLDEPPHHAPVRLEMKSTRAAQSSWRRYYLAPGHFYGETQHTYPLEVLAEILGGGSSSRLYQSLVLTQRLALTAGADYAPACLGPAVFSIHATARNGVAIGDLEAAIDVELRRLADEGVTDDEVLRAETRMQSAAIYSRDSLSGPANIIGAALTLGRTIDDVTQWPERIAKVTTAQIQAAARAVLIERNAATGILLPEHTS